MSGRGREWKKDVSQESQESSYTCYIDKYHFSVPNFDTDENRTFSCACWSQHLRGVTPGDQTLLRDPLHIRMWRQGQNCRCGPSHNPWIPRYWATLASPKEKAGFLPMHTLKLLVSFFWSILSLICPGKGPMWSLLLQTTIISLKLLGAWVDLVAGGDHQGTITGP